MSGAILGEQLAYYRARAGEYDEWFFRTGRYDRGPEAAARWFDEVEDVRSWLRGLGDLGEVVEPAAGTGLWTNELRAQASSVHALDASPEVLAINRWRCGADARVSYEEVDLFEWRPSRTYDTAFMGFWLSHVPDPLLAGFWQGVRSALRPGGRALFVDSLPDPGSTARDHVLEGEGEVTRLLNDGRSFRIVKRFREPEELAALLGGEATRTATYFVYGAAAAGSGAD